MADKKERGGMEAGHHLMIHKHENGGHTVEHHKPPKSSRSGAFMEHDSETHAFGPEEHGKMMEHLHAKLGVPMEHEAMEEEPEPESV